MGGNEESTPCTVRTVHPMDDSNPLRNAVDDAQEVGPHVPWRRGSRTTGMLAGSSLTGLSECVTLCLTSGSLCQRSKIMKMPSPERFLFLFLPPSSFFLLPSSFFLRPSSFLLPPSSFFLLPLLPSSFFLLHYSFYCFS